MLTETPGLVIYVNLEIVGTSEARIRQTSGYLCGHWGICGIRGIWLFLVEVDDQISI